MHSEDAGEETTPATCTAEGIKTFHCSSCGEETRTESISALGHDMVVDKELSREATPEGDGVEIKRCSRCGEQSEGTVLHYPESIWRMVRETEEGYEYLEAYCGSDMPPADAILVQFCMACMESEGIEVVAEQKSVSECIVAEEREEETIYHICAGETMHIYRTVYVGEEEKILSAVGRVCMSHDYACDLTKHELVQQEDGSMYCVDCGTAVDAFHDADGMLVRDWCGMYGHIYDEITVYTDFTYNCEQSVWNEHCRLCYDEAAMRTTPITPENMPEDSDETMRAFLLGGISHTIMTYTLHYTSAETGQAVVIPLEIGSAVQITEAELSGATLMGRCGNTYLEQQCGHEEDVVSAGKSIWDFFGEDESGAGYIYYGKQE